MIPDAKKIKVLRKSIGMTQLNLAKMLNMSQPAISRIEKGEIDPPYSKAKKLFDFLLDLKEKNTNIELKNMNKKMILLGDYIKISEELLKVKKLIRT